MSKTVKPTSGNVTKKKVEPVKVASSKTTAKAKTSTASKVTAPAVKTSTAKTSAPKKASVKTTTPKKATVVKDEVLEVNTIATTEIREGKVEPTPVAVIEPPKKPKTAGKKSTTKTTKKSTAKASTLPEEIKEELPSTIEVNDEVAITEEIEMAEPIQVTEEVNEQPQQIATVEEQPKEKQPKKSEKTKKETEQTFGEDQINHRQAVLKKVFTIVFFVFVIGVLAFTFYNDFFGNSDKETISFAQMLSFWKVNWYYLIFAILALGCAYLLKGLKLSVMCKSMTGRWHFKTCMYTGAIGHYMNCVTPLAVGGQPFEIMYLSKHGVHGGVASSLPIATFFLNQFGFVFASIVALILYNTHALGLPSNLAFEPSTVTTLNILASIGLICCFAVPFMVLLFCLFPGAGASLVHLVMKMGGKLHLVKNPQLTTYKTIKNISHNSRCLKKMTKNPFVTISTFIMSIGEWLSLCSIAYFSMRFFGFDMPEVGGFIEWALIIEICLILYAGVSFVPTPGNAGAADLSFYLLFEIAFASLDLFGAAFPAMMCWRILSFYAFIVIGFFVNGHIKRRDTKLALKLENSQLPSSK